MSDVLLFSENFEGDVQSNWFLTHAEVLSNQFGNSSHFLTNSHDTHPAGAAMYGAEYKKSILYENLGSLNFKVTIDTITTSETTDVSPVECEIMVLDENGYMIGGCVDDNMLVTPEWSTKTLDKWVFTFNEGDIPKYFRFYFYGNLNAIDNINVYNIIE